MEKKYQDFEKQIKAKTSFSSTPSYTESFKTSLKATVFVEIARRSFEELGWTVVYAQDNTAEAKRSDKYGTFTEKIIAEVDARGDVVVKSESLGNEIIDMGRNCKRVRLFIYAFGEILQNFDAKTLAEIETEIENKDDWADYQEPETLSAPPKFKNPQYLFPLVGSIVLAFGLAYALAFVSLKAIYIIGLYEVAIGFIFGFVGKYLIRLGNFTNVNKLLMFQALGVILCYGFNQYFQYTIVMAENPTEAMTFGEFMKYRLEFGLTIDELELGWIGLLVSWVLQFFLTMYVIYFRTISAVIQLSILRIPTDVIEFALFHLVKTEDEMQVRRELSKKGWTSELEQQAVFMAIVNIQAQKDLLRQ